SEFIFSVYRPLAQRVRMRRMRAAKAVATRATCMTGIMFEMSARPVDARGMGAHSSMAFDAAHSPSGRHFQSQRYVDLLPAIIRPKLAMRALFVRHVPSFQFNPSYPAGSLRLSASRSLRRAA